MDEITSYQDLDVWKQTKDLVTEIYKVTKGFPSDERFGFVDQIRRASVPIPSNIAEGCGRNSSKDAARFFFIARGSLYELETQLIISFELGYLNDIKRDEIIDRILNCKRLLNGFINYFKKLQPKKSN